MKKRIGILGGGQLAMFLCAAARPMGLETTVLAHGEDSPATFTADRTLRGRFDDLACVDELIAAADVVTFDVEDIPPATLEHLAARAEAGVVEVAPRPATLLTLGDKLVQKQWLEAHDLPTTPFVAVEAAADDAGARAELVERFGLPFVQKARRGGYDGRGVQIIRTEQELGGLWPVPSLVEAFVPDARELAVVAARDIEGNVRCYEVNELLFEPQNNILDTVIAPARISADLREEALSLTRRTLDGLGSAGVFALEFFVTTDQTVLINEISPRVHNTGHHTMESTDTSQFQQHLRAICGSPLGSTNQQGYAVMRNILGPEQPDAPHPREVVCQADLESQTYVHWYGKQQMKAWRKMGHITALGATAEEALTRAGEAHEQLFAPGGSA